MGVLAQGSNAKLRMYPEVTAGTFVGSVNYNQVPFFSLNMSKTQGLDQDALLSAVANRDSADPYFGLIRVEGDVVVPLDTVHFARWLRLLCGAPATSGATNYTHLFTSGSAALPSNSMEVAHADLATDAFIRTAGVRANTLRVSLGPDGAGQATIGLMGLSQVSAASTGAGTAVVTSFARYFNAQGVLARGGSTLAGITSCDFTFTNDMEMVAAVRGDYRMEDIDFGLAAASGTFTSRFETIALYDAAVATQSAAAITYTWTIDVNTSISFNFGRTYITPQGAPISGPRGIAQTFRWVAGPHASTGVMQVTVKNQIAAYSAS